MWMWGCLKLILYLKFVAWEIEKNDIDLNLYDDTQKYFVMVGYNELFLKFLATSGGMSLSSVKRLDQFSELLNDS